MKKYIAGLITGILITLSITAFADSTIKQAIFTTDIKLKVNGNPTQAEFVNVDGTNYAKVRDIVSAIGGVTAWDAETKTILVNTVKEDANVSTTNQIKEVNGLKYGEISDPNPPTLDEPNPVRTHKILPEGAEKTTYKEFTDAVKYDGKIFVSKKHLKDYKIGVTTKGDKITVSRVIRGIIEKTIFDKSGNLLNDNGNYYVNYDIVKDFIAEHIEESNKSN